MANNCAFGMKINGTKENLKKFIDYATAYYEYKDNNTVECTADKHFFRIFSIYTSKDKEGNIEYIKIGDNKFSIYMSGDCAWSVYSCMFEGNYTYYNEMVNHKCFKGTTIPLVSKELNLEIEIFSEEPGEGFMEHFLIKNGEILINDCIDYTEEYDEETGEFTRIGGMEWKYAI